MYISQHSFARISSYSVVNFNSTVDATKMVKSDGSFQPNELKTHLVEVLEESSNSQKNQLNVSANVDNPDSNIKVFMKI